MAEVFRRENIILHNGDIVSFEYDGKERKGLLFYEETDKNFMILLSEDVIISADEVVKTLKLV